MSLEGKIAIVTGASRGIGRAIALALADEGVAVALGSRSLEELGQLASTIESQGGRAVAVPLDVTYKASI